MLVATRRTKPLPGAGLNLANPSVRGLILAVPFWEGAGPPRDVVTGKAATTANYAWSAGSGGLAGTFNGTSTDVKFTGVAPIAQTITVIMRAAFSISANGMLIEAETVNAAWEMFCDSGGVITVRGKTANALVSLSSASNGIAAFEWHTIGFTVGPGTTMTTRFFKDGALLSTGAFANTNAPTSSGVPIHIGCYDNNGFFLNGKVEFAFVWNRELQPDEVVRVSANPYGLFAGGAAWRPFAPTAAGGAGNPYYYRHLAGAGSM